MADESDRLRALYGEGYVPVGPGDDDRSTADLLAAYRPPGKGERLQRAWRAFRDQGAADMARRAEQPLATQFADFGRMAVTAPLGARGGMGGSTGGMGYLAPRYSSTAMPEALHFPGGLGLLDEVPWLARGFAAQPREILGAGVAPPLALTKADATPMPDAEALWEAAGKSYPLRAQAQRIVNDVRDKPVYHTWNSLRQIPMAMGYTGAAEGAMALGALQRLPAWLRAPEPPTAGTLLAAPREAR